MEIPQWDMEMKPFLDTTISILPGLGHCRNYLIPPTLHYYPPPPPISYVDLVNDRKPFHPDSYYYVRHPWQTVLPTPGGGGLWKIRHVTISMYICWWCCTGKTPPTNSFLPQMFILTPPPTVVDPQGQLLYDPPLHPNPWFKVWSQVLWIPLGLIATGIHQ